MYVAKGINALHRLLIASVIGLLVGLIFSVISFWMVKVNGGGEDIAMLYQEALDEVSNLNTGDDALQTLYASLPDPDLDVSLDIDPITLPRPPRVDDRGISVLGPQVDRINRLALEEWENAQNQLDSSLQAAKLDVERQLLDAEARLQTQIDATRTEVSNWFTAIQASQDRISLLLERLDVLTPSFVQKALENWIPALTGLISALGTVWYANKQHKIDLKDLAEKTADEISKIQATRVVEPTKNDTT